jgi:hypothetical protein
MKVIEKNTIEFIDQILYNRNINTHKSEKCFLDIKWALLIPRYMNFFNKNYSKIHSNQIKLNLNLSYHRYFVNDIKIY